VPGQMAENRTGLHVAVRTDLRDAAKAKAHGEGRSMTQLIEHAFAEYLAGRLPLPPPATDDA
jgi:hypothetical protein